MKDGWLIGWMQEWLGLQFQGKGFWMPSFSFFYFSGTEDASQTEKRDKDLQTADSAGEAINFTPSSTNAQVGNIGLKSVPRRRSVCKTCCTVLLACKPRLASVILLKPWAPAIISSSSLICCLTWTWSDYREMRHETNYICHEQTILVSLWVDFCHLSHFCQ